MNEMQAKMKQVGRTVSVCMGVTISFFLSLVGMGTSGHFTWPGWLVSFLLSLIVSLILGFLIPMKRVTDGAVRKAKLQPDTWKARFLESLISDLIYTPLITFLMVLLAYLSAPRQAYRAALRNAAAQGAPEAAAQGAAQAAMEGARASLSFWRMFLPSLGICFVVGFVLICLLMPVFVRFAMKRSGVGAPPRTDAR